MLRTRNCGQEQVDRVEHGASIEIALDNRCDPGIRVPYIPRYIPDAATAAALTRCTILEVPSPAHSGRQTTVLQLEQIRNATCVEIEFN